MGWGFEVFRDGSVKFWAASSALKVSMAILRVFCRLDSSEIDIFHEVRDLNLFAPHLSPFVYIYMTAWFHGALRAWLKRNRFNRIIWEYSDGEWRRNCDPFENWACESYCGSGNRILDIGQWTRVWSSQTPQNPATSMKLAEFWWSNEANENWRTSTNSQR